MALALVLAGALAGCGVRTNLAITATPTGTGTVAVTVTLDKAATAAVGDVAAKLRTSDLAAEGWHVDPPKTTSDGSTVIRAVHRFASLSEVSTIVAGVAGHGPASSRPFRLQVSEHHGFWSAGAELHGRVDLTCDLACFGDQGLAHQLGSPTGVATGPVASQRQRFAFSVTATLPGSVATTDATSRSTVGSATTLQWSPVLGTSTVLAASTSSVDINKVVGTAVAALLVLVALLGAGWWWWRRHKRPRRARGAHASASRRVAPRTHRRQGS